MDEVSIEGKVVGMLIRDGRRVAKVPIGPHVVEVDAANTPDAHRGDRLRLATTLITLAATEEGRHA
jgi:hypothetical protein